MPTTIPISDVVNTSFFFSVQAQQNKGFGRLLVLGDSATATRPLLTPKLYDNETWDSQLLADGYLVTDEEYIAVQTWFSQSPKPNDCLVALTATTPTVTDVIACENLDDTWYFLSVACQALQLTTAEITPIADWIEAKVKIFGYTDMDVANIDTPYVGPTVLGDLLDLYRRTFVMFDDNDAYAHVSLMARFATINYLSPNSAITGKFKRLPTISPMNISLAQANSVRGNKGNYYAYYADSPMVAEGTMTDGTWIDVVHSSDWLQNRMQTEMFNILYKTTTKIPQTDAGVERLVNGVRRIAELAVVAGILTPRKWRGDDIGTLRNGDFLATGYSIQVGKVDDMTQADYDARYAPTITFCGNLSGAIHKAFLTGYLV